MQFWEFKCNKCQKDYERFCSYNDIKKQKCEICGRKLKRVYTSFKINGFPKGWSTFNNSDMAKPRTELEQKRYREFMENSIPISQSTT